MGGDDGTVHPFLSSALDTVAVSSGHIYPTESRSCGTNWVSPSAALGNMKKSGPCRESNPSCLPVASHHSRPQVPLLKGYHRSCEDGDALRSARGRLRVLPETPEVDADVSVCSRLKPVRTGHTSSCLSVCLSVRMSVCPSCCLHAEWTALGSQ
jgi:hypothetical protein